MCVCGPLPSPLYFFYNKFCICLYDFYAFHTYTNMTPIHFISSEYNFVDADLKARPHLERVASCIALLLDVQHERSQDGGWLHSVGHG
jgi:hypothetical protein